MTRKVFWRLPLFLAAKTLFQDQTGRIGHMDFRRSIARLSCSDDNVSNVEVVVNSRFSWGIPASLIAHS